MRLICFIFFYFFIFISFSQEKYANEIGLLTENDLYTSITNDRYYTNGFFLSYRHLSSKKNNNLVKKIIEWQIGHKMYSPYKATVESILEHDRPFAAYLYAGIGINRFYSNNSILSTNLQIGNIGKNAFGRELQDFMHDIYKFKKTTGWKHQIKEALGINLNTNYVKHITVNKSKSLDIAWLANAKLGSVDMALSSGFYSRFGVKPLQTLLNSIAFNSNLNDKDTNFTRATEVFFYIKPMLNYVLYDATLQGSFLNTKVHDVTAELIPIFFSVDIGFKFTLNRFNLGYTYHYNTNTSKNLRFNNGHIYGGISLNYLLK